MFSRGLAFETGELIAVEGARPKLDVRCRVFHMHAFLRDVGQGREVSHRV